MSDGAVLPAMSFIVLCTVKRSRVLENSRVYEFYTGTAIRNSSLKDGATWFHHCCKRTLYEWSSVAQTRALASCSGADLFWMKQKILFVSSSSTSQYICLNQWLCENYLEHINGLIWRDGFNSTLRDCFRASSGHENRIILVSCAKEWILMDVWLFIHRRDP